MGLFRKVRVLAAMADRVIQQARVIQSLEEFRENAEDTVHGLEELIAVIQTARSNHPECDKYEPGDPVTCGWKRVVQDIDKALEDYERGHHD